jgi:hypothetical protein
VVQILRAGRGKLGTLLGKKEMEALPILDINALWLPCFTTLLVVTYICKPQTFWVECNGIVSYGPLHYFY